MNNKPKEMQKFSTGAIREKKQGKGRFDLISPLAMKRIAAVYEEGCSLHGARNYEKGLPMSSCFDSGKRHINQYEEGHRDPVKEDHLAKVCWNFITALHFDECMRRGILPAELMDLPNYVQRTWPELQEIANELAQQDMELHPVDKRAGWQETVQQAMEPDYPDEMAVYPPVVPTKANRKTHLPVQQGQEQQQEPDASLIFSPLSREPQVNPDMYLPVGSRVVNVIGLKGKVIEFDFKFPNHRLVELDATPGLPAKIHVLDLVEDN